MHGLSSVANLLKLREVTIVKKILYAILIFLVIVGCVGMQPKTWYKAGATEETTRRDKMTCRQYGMQSAQAHGLAGNLFVESWIQEETEKCMRELGYQ